MRHLTHESPASHPVRAGLSHAANEPAVTWVAHEVQERRQRSLVGPHRRVRPLARIHPRVDLCRGPLPRPHPGELLEPAHQSLSTIHDARAEPTRRLLALAIKVGSGCRVRAFARPW
jgi:hypothetical protein